MLVSTREVFVGSLDGNCEMVFVVGVIVVWFFANRASWGVVADFFRDKVGITVESD